VAAVVAAAVRVAQTIASEVRGASKSLIGKRKTRNVTNGSDFSGALRGAIGEAGQEVGSTLRPLKTKAPRRLTAFSD
jgi:hypothetical protein